MAAETLPLSNSAVANGDLSSNPNPIPNEAVAAVSRRRTPTPPKAPQQAFPQVEVEYVPEPAKLDDGMDEKFRKIFSQLSFRETTATQDNDNKHESAENAASTKKADSDSEEEEHDKPQKEKGVSNKKKKLQRQMQIAELKQICSRPDVVEGKCGIEKQPFQIPDFFAATGIEKIRQRSGRVEEEIEMLQLKLKHIGERIAFSGRFK